jgi:hypothetical protein
MNKYSSILQTSSPVSRGNDPSSHPFSYWGMIGPRGARMAKSKAAARPEILVDYSRFKGPFLEQKMS